MALASRNFLELAQPALGMSVRPRYECVCVTDKVGGQQQILRIHVSISRELAKAQGPPSCPHLFLRPCFREAKFSIYWKEP